MLESIEEGLRDGRARRRLETARSDDRRRETMAINEPKEKETSRLLTEG
jgi:hypothetical protein